VVVTGGIGSGKSLVCSLLADLGVVVIDADSLGHAVLAPGGEAFPKVAARWPEVVSDGKIIRSRLGEIVFAAHEQLAELVAITHPYIRARMQAEVDRHPENPVAVEISAPSEYVMPDWPVLVVDADSGAIHRRLLQRGMSEGDIRRRQESQRSRQQWLEMADEVVANLFDQEELAEEVKSVAQRLGLVSH
jgi:dephospho-CoA kinase